MANAYICDACGKFYKEYKPLYILKANYGFERRYDICPNCGTEFSVLKGDIK